MNHGQSSLYTEKGIPYRLSAIPLRSSDTGSHVALTCLGNRLVVGGLAAPEAASLESVAEPEQEGEGVG